MVTRFQERVLSRRCLFFFSEHVVFRCRNGLWREDLILESPRLRVRESSIVWQYGAVGTQINEKISLEAHEKRQRQIQPLRDYQNAMREYSIRRLTFESDAMNACMGIFEQIAKTMDFDLYYCLPQQFFELGLLWYGGEGRRLGLPSWSWIGWKGKTRLGLDIYRRGDIVWWLSTDCWISWTRLDSEPLHLTIAEEAGLYLPEDLNKIPPNIDKALTLPWRPPREFVLKDYYLRFWTFSIRLKISHAIKQGEERSGIDAEIAKPPTVFDLRDRNQGFAGRLLSHAHPVPHSAEGPPEIETELLVISRQRFHSTHESGIADNDLHLFLGFNDGTTYPESYLTDDHLIDLKSGIALGPADAQLAKESYPDKEGQHPLRLYDVLEIMWRDDGVAERVGIGKVLISAVQKSLDPGVTWKEIVLG